MQIVAPPGENGMRVDGHFDVEVASRATAGTHLTLAGQVDSRAAVDASGDSDGHGALRAHPAVAGALEARVGDDLAESLTGGARPRGHDLTEEAALDLLDLAAPTAYVAPPGAGARLRAVTLAGAAGGGRLDRELPFAAEDGVHQLHGQPHEAVLTPAGARARAAGRPPGPGAEEGVHDVAEGEALTEAGVRPAIRIIAQIELATLVRVGQDVIRLGDTLEPLLGLRTGVDVRVQLAGEPAVGLLDRLGAGVPGHPEILVVVVHLILDRFVG